MGEFFDPYVGISVGWAPDITGVVFARWEIHNKLLTVESALEVKQLSTFGLACGLRETEEKLWGTRKPYLRVSDCKPEFAGTLSVNESINVIPALPEDDRLAYDAMRKMIQGHPERHLVIKKSGPGCADLIRQLHGAIWNERGNEFQQTSADGTYRLARALAQVCRRVSWEHNPEPKDYGFDPSKMFRYEQPDARRTNLGKRLKRLWG